MKTIKDNLKRAIYFIKKKEALPVPYPVYSDRMLEGHYALITGGSSGIGFAIAKEFIANGCKVVIAGRDIKKLKAAADNLGGWSM